MTGLTTFQPGHELRCFRCEFRIGDSLRPDCQVACEMRAAGERMSEACCPTPTPRRLFNDMRAGRRRILEAAA